MFIKLEDITSFKTYRKEIKIFKEEDTVNNILIKNGNSTIDGFSYPAKKKVSFVINQGNNNIINWRETAICPITHLSTRKRIIFHILNEYCAPRFDSSIFIAENSEFSAFTKNVFKNTIFSEYLGAGYTPGSIHNNVMHQDFTKLSFVDGSIDFVLHSDVFEHIPDYLTGFKECFRVLKKGGRMIWTVPFAANEDKNIIRAYINEQNQIIHLYPPEYHGDPLDPNGILCFRYFGWQMFEELKNIGFREAFTLVTWSKEFCYLDDDNFVFLAIK